MKKDKRKPVNATRKAIKKDIQLNLAAKMKEVMDEFGQSSKKLEKEIEKTLGKLAKKLSKKLKTNQLDNLEAGKNQKSAPDLNLENTAKASRTSSNLIKSSAHQAGSKTAKVKQEA